MHDTLLNLSNRQIDQSPGWLSSQQRADDSRIPICHVSEGSTWAGAEVHVATLLRALSTFPEIILHAIVLHEGRLARELRSFGVAVQVVNEKQKSFAQVVS